MEQLQSPPNSSDERKMFAEIKRDLPRATFIIKGTSLDPNQPPEEELLFNHNDKIGVMAELSAEAEAHGESPDEKILAERSTTILQERGIQKFKSYVGNNRALQIAIGSLMYQRGAADLEFMKYDFSRDPQAALAPYFTKGLQSVRILQDNSTLRIGTKSEKQIIYSLEKEPLQDNRNLFKLTIFSSSTEERVYLENEQEFTLHTADLLIYTFEENPSFNVNNPLSLDHLPVIISCNAGKLLHQLTPFEGVRPPLPDTISLSQWDSLTEDQQAVVTAYQKAEHKYCAANENWKSRFAYLASHPNLGPLISSERIKGEKQLKSLHSVLQEKAALVAQDPIIAPFLERNFTIASGFHFTFLNEENKKLDLPEKFSFVGGRKLQHLFTRQFEVTLLNFINNGQLNLNGLVGTAKKLGIESVEGLSSSFASLNSTSDEGASQALLDLTENKEITRGIHMLIEDAASTMIPLLHEEPFFGDMVPLLSNAEAHFSLEKKRHPSSEKPFFILTSECQITHTSPDYMDENKNILRTLDVRVVYALRENPAWNYNKLNSLTNLPIDVRCVDIHVDQNVQCVPVSTLIRDNIG
ncbi:MAG: hypothetical protein ACOYK6_06930 [Chthoniobacterales bacterium]